MKINEDKKILEFGLPRHFNHNINAFIDDIVFYLFMKENIKNDVKFNDSTEMFKNFVEFENTLIEDAEKFFNEQLNKEGEKK